MQQAYRALRVVAEAQTIRVVLTPDPSELMLDELRTVCAGLTGEGSSGIKAVVLDFMPDVDVRGVAVTGLSQGVSPVNPGDSVPNMGHRRSIGAGQQRSADGEDTAVISLSRIEETSAAIRSVAQPVLAVVQGTLSASACSLVRSADLTLAANDAVLLVPLTESENDTLTGAQAARLGYVNWCASANELRKEMERILNMLRGSSAVALRHTKASVRLANTNAPNTSLEALQQVNDFYLTEVMQTADAHEGLQAFLEKRKPDWKNS